MCWDCPGQLAPAHRKAALGERKEPVMETYGYGKMRLINGIENVSL